MIKVIVLSTLLCRLMLIGRWTCELDIEKCGKPMTITRSMAVEWTATRHTARWLGVSLDHWTDWHRLSGESSNEALVCIHFQIRALMYATVCHSVGMLNRTFCFYWRPKGVMHDGYGRFDWSWLRLRNAWDTETMTYRAKHTVTWTTVNRARDWYGRKCR